MAMVYEIILGRSEEERKKTKAIIINTPNNPTGAVYSKSDLKAIADICADNGIFDKWIYLVAHNPGRHYSTPHGWP